MHTEEIFDIRFDILGRKTLHQYIGPGGHIVIPDGVEVIEYIAYDKKKTITGITIPDSVSEIAATAFVHCRGLADQNGFVIVRNVLYQYFGPGGLVVIPDGVEKISPMAFAGQKKVTGVTIPDSVKELDKDTFAGCKGMADQNGFVVFQNYLCSYHGLDSRIIVPESVTEIGPCFFSGVLMESMVIPGPETRYNEDGTIPGVLYLQELVIPDSVKRIDPNLRFPEEKTLYNIIAPMPVMEIIWNNFSVQYKTRECLGYLDGTLARHENYTALIQAYIKKSKKKFFKLICGQDDAQMMERFLNILQSVKLEQIDDYLQACTGKPNLTAYLLNYQKDHFTNQQIQNLYEEATKKELGIKGKTVADWRKVFKFTISDGCVEITDYIGTETNVVIPEKIGKNMVTGIGERAFRERGDLTGIVLPDSITHIDSQAFICCSGLTEFVIPMGLTYLGNGAFAGCTGITAVAVPPTITEIRSTAFFACEALSFVYIPASVKTICSNAFEGCPKLTIHAPAGSYAEEFANKYKIPFVAE